MPILIYIILGVVVFIILISIKQINQYQMGVKFMFGAFEKFGEKSNV